MVTLCHVKVRVCLLLLYMHSVQHWMQPMPTGLIQNKKSWLRFSGGSKISQTGGDNPRGRPTYYLEIFFWKLHESGTNWTSRPLGSANIGTDNKHLTFLQSFVLTRVFFIFRYTMSWKPMLKPGNSVKMTVAFCLWHLINTSWGFSQKGRPGNRTYNRYYPQLMTENFPSNRGFLAICS